MPMLTLGEAARHCGVPKSTISRAIKSGRLSAGRDDAGSYAIDPAELHRVYPIKIIPEGDATGATDGADGGVARDATPSPVPSNPAVEQGLAVRLATAEAELRGLREMVEELRRSRDKWEAQAERLTLTLPAPANAAPARQGLLGWLRRA